MSENVELDYLRRQLQERDREIDKLRAENTRRRQGKRSAVEQYEREIAQLREANEAMNAQLEEIAAEVEAASTEWEEQLTALTTERDEALQRAESAPDDYREELETLRREKLESTHRDAFKDLYADPEIGLDDKLPVDQLWKALDYKAEGDPDKAKVKALLAEKLKSDAFGWLPRRSKGEADAPPATDPAPARDGLAPPGRPGAGIVRGGGAVATEGKFLVTEGQMRDASWTVKNWDAISKARADGTYLLVDDAGKPVA